MQRLSLGILAVLTAGTAQAATVGIESGMTLASRPNEGVFSSYVTTSGVFTERFNSATALTTCGIQHTQDVSVSNLGSGDAGLASGRYIHRALPPGTNSASIAAGRVDTDQSCYLSTPNPLSAANQTATLNPVTLTVNRTRTPVLYVGWYWGSIDSYNSVQFFDKLGNRINFSNVPGSSITGQDIINLFGLGAAESRFIDFQFTAAENFGYALLSSGNTAFELDNLSYATFNPVPPPAPAARARFALALSPLAVPEPALAGLLGLGTLGLVVGRSRRRGLG